MIKGSRLGFSYFWDGESIPVFEQANIELKEGEWTAILGCNGCGKFHACASDERIAAASGR